MKQTYLLLALLFSFPSFSQTGPGGVGNDNGRSPLCLWLDAATVDGETGDTVTVWNDRSGRGHHFTGGKGAVVTRAAVNGHDALAFDGRHHYFDHPFTAALNPATFTMFFVSKAANTGNYQALISSRDDTGESRTGYMVYAKPHSNDWSFWTAKATTEWLRLTGESTAERWSGQVIHYQGGTDGKELQVACAPTIHSSSPYLPNVRRPTRIGAGLNEGSQSGFHFRGEIAEVIIFGTSLNRSQRLIVSNYLAAKYDYALPKASNSYRMDDPLEGDYDHEVAGIGRFNTFDLHPHARGGVVRMRSPSDLDDDEFLFWGHDGGSITATQTADVPAGASARVQRVWRVSETNAAGEVPVDVGSVIVSFQLSGLGEISTNDLCLLIDSNNDGFFDDETPISGAHNVRGTTFMFRDVTALRHGSRFTVGLLNSQGALATRDR
ncbi:hypothetical protein [Lewinella sp. IMCC34183]|uniref:hypothetical protein n=1 Tax=Lewinella sp. IMCC34183 TaxID=2248762 RepID=UPI000E260782|nr:hypothetical protein [Lewinella sp. IMCC34183]